MDTATLPSPPLSEKDRNQNDKPGKLTVFFDGSCPLCVREISFYRKRKGAAAIDWVDVSAIAPDQDATPGLSKCDAMARFHVKTVAGHLYSGAKAFAEVWAALPAFRLLYWMAQLPGMLALMEWAYDRFLLVRPRVQHWVSNAIAQADTGYPKWLIQDLRSDHAGETGAVYIYKGILAVSRDPDVRAFATEHMATEAEHLRLIEGVFPTRLHSRLLPLWRVAGFMTGFLPALFGPRAVFKTVEAVETFVDQHYRAQTDRLASEGLFPDLHALLERCRLDEVHHRDDAGGRAPEPAGPVIKAWAWCVGNGSAAAVHAAKRI